jgi:Concanavalin A-like lectin/glucanases superfamily
MGNFGARARSSRIAVPMDQLIDEIFQDFLEAWKDWIYEDLSLGEYMHLAFSPVNSPTVVAGKPSSTGTRCASASEQSLVTASIPGLSSDGVPMTFSLWVKFTTLNDAAILSKWGDGKDEYELKCNGDFLLWKVKPNGLGTVQVTLLDELSTDQWYHVLCEIDPGASEARLTVDNSSSGSVALLADIQPAAAMLRIATDEDLDEYADITVSDLTIWRRILTAGEKARIYAAGAGLAYPFV